MATAPNRQVCKLCSLEDDDLVSWQVEGPGLWRYTCTNHPEPYWWLTTGRDPLNTEGHEGLSIELGIYEDLLACFSPGAPWLEYGVVEYRYAQANRAAYKKLVGYYSHTAAESGLQYTASAFIGAALGKLQREGLLASRTCKATGYWSYNGTLNAWALPPSNADADITTWEQFGGTLPTGAKAWPLDELLGSEEA